MMTLGPRWPVVAASLACGTAVNAQQRVRPSPRPAAAESYEVSVRIWPRAMGDPIDVAVAIDGRPRGTLSNIQQADTLPLGRLAAGEHTFRLSRITAYRGLGASRAELMPVVSGLTCSGAFVVNARRSFALHVQATNGGKRLTCALE
jgi:hypothetical protein